VGGWEPKYLRLVAVGSSAPLRSVCDPASTTELGLGHNFALHRIGKLGRGYEFDKRSSRILLSISTQGRIEVVCNCWSGLLFIRSEECFEMLGTSVTVKLIFGS
jgi:hypothetical protein